jgi:hypothetical protein
MTEQEQPAECACGCGEVASNGAYAGTGNSERSTHRVRAMRKREAAAKDAKVAAARHLDDLQRMGLQDAALGELVATAAVIGPRLLVVLNEIGMRSEALDEKAVEQRLLEARSARAEEVDQLRAQCRALETALREESERAQRGARQAAEADEHAAAVSERLIALEAAHRQVLDDLAAERDARQAAEQTADAAGNEIGRLVQIVKLHSDHLPAPIDGLSAGSMSPVPCTGVPGT